MQITFQRYLDEDEHLLKENFPKVPFLEAMRRQFEAELDEAQAPTYTLVKERLGAKAARHVWCEYVLDFPAFEGRETKDVVAVVQELYDTGGLAGNFLLGDKRFDY